MNFVQREVIRKTGHATQKEAGVQQTRANAILKHLRQKHHLPLEVIVNRKELPVSEFTVHPDRGNQLKTSWGTLNLLDDNEAIAFLSHKMDYVRRHPNIQSYNNSCEKRETAGMIISGVAALGIAIFGLSASNIGMLFSAVTFTALAAACVKSEVFSAPFRRKHVYKADEAGARETSPQTMVNAITKIEASRTALYKEAGFTTAKPLSLNIGEAFGKATAGAVNSYRKKLHKHMSDEQVTEMYARNCRSFAERVYETCSLFSGTPSESARLKHLQRVAWKNAAGGAQVTV